MRICPKCSKRVSGDSKICRDCGAILEDIPDDSVPGPGVESTTPFGFPLAAKHQESVGEVVAESQEPSPPDSEAPSWKCPQCGETVPGTFDVCWKCQTTKDALAKRNEIRPIKIDYPATVRWDYLPKGSLRTHNPSFKPVDNPRGMERPAIR